MVQNFNLACVLFDLDGTLADTAPDLLAALTRAMGGLGLGTPPIARVRPYISYGAAAMVREGLNGTCTEQKHKQVLDAMLGDYQQHLAEQTTLFTGMRDVLNGLEAKGIKWGVVTNKRRRFTMPLMDALHLTDRAACIISGDTTTKQKPHPEPMLTACLKAGVKPEQCLYIGDSAHDIAAGKSVKMKTLAAVYGYLKPADDPGAWGADHLIYSPTEILPWIEKATCN
jgi:N-acetyl-D-muramate 6-phosphate phosphatase